MTVVTVERVVQRPPEVVFDFVARHHFDNHPRRDPDLVEMSQTYRGPVEVGSTARVVRRQGRRVVEGTAMLYAYEPDQVAVWDVRSGRSASTSGRSSSPSAAEPRRAFGWASPPPPTDPMRVILPLLRARFRNTMRRSLGTIPALLEDQQT